MAPSLRARYWRILLGARPRPVQEPPGPLPPAEPEKPAEVTEYEGWAIVSLYGKQRIAGYVTCEERFGRPFVRIDATGPAGIDVALTRYQHPDSVWGFTPCTYVAAVAASRACDDPAPVQAWELPRPEPQRPSAGRVHSSDPWSGDERDQPRREPPF